MTISVIFSPKIALKALRSLSLHRITGEGRMRCRFGKKKAKDLKKKEHRKMAKKSRRQNRR